MNEMVERGEAVRIGHFANLNVAHKAIRNWAQQKTDFLEVTIPSQVACKKVEQPVSA
jgi:nucleoid DNA-binding protein